MYYSEVWKILKQFKWCRGWKGWWRKFQLHTGFNEPPRFVCLFFGFDFNFSPQPCSWPLFPLSQTANLVAILTLLLELEGGDIFTVHRTTEILHPLVYSPLFLERDVCSRVAPGSVLHCSHTTLSCRRGGSFFQSLLQKLASGSPPEMWKFELVLLPHCQLFSVPLYYPTVCQSVVH